MKLNGENLKTLAVYPDLLTVPDCNVVLSNKIGEGHGEAKLYIGSKETMRDFYGGKGFAAKCFMLKKDLVDYMIAIKKEYMNPSQPYSKAAELPDLWQKRLDKINACDEIIFFSMEDQTQIVGPRGYVNSDDLGYKIIREISLPLISYIYIEKIGDDKNPLFYWKLLVDFDAIWEKQNMPLVFTYGKSADNKEEEVKAKEETSKQKEARQSRIGQEKYREQLLEQCHCCPITTIADDRLLIASHIKPWVASEDDEKIDPYNGYMLSPLYDKLFDKGFITFTESKKVVLSELLSAHTWKLTNLKNGQCISILPMDAKREKYLDFHHKSVFKGDYDSCVASI